MNLTQYKAALKSYSDFNPTNPVYDNELDAYVNLAYFSIWNTRKWNFAQKNELIRFFPDLDFGRTGLNVNLTPFTRSVTFSAALHVLVM